jgi:hypothetical protein
MYGLQVNPKTNGGNMTTENAVEVDLSRAMVEFIPCVEDMELLGADVSKNTEKPIGEDVDDSQWEKQRVEYLAGVDPSFLAPSRVFGSGVLFPEPSDLPFKMPLVEMESGERLFDGRVVAQLGGTLDMYSVLTLKGLIALGEELVEACAHECQFEVAGISKLKHMRFPYADFRFSRAVEVLDRIAPSLGAGDRLWAELEKELVEARRQGEIFARTGDFDPPWTVAQEA